MKFGKFIFESMEEFNQVKKIAKDKGVNTAQEFFDFLSQNYSYKMA